MKVEMRKAMMAIMTARPGTSLRKLNIENGNFDITATTKDQMEPLSVICRAGIRKGSRRGSTV